MITKALSGQSSEDQAIRKVQTLPGFAEVSEDTVRDIVRYWNGK